MIPRFSFIPVASVMHNEDALNRLIADYTSVLETLGGQCVAPAAIDTPNPLLIFVITGGTEEKILKLWHEREKLCGVAPITLLAHPWHNALPAALEVLARLQQSSLPGRILYLDGLQDTTGLARVDAAVHDLEVRQALQKARIGLVGQASDWLVASHPEPATVRQTWGPEVLSIPVETLYEKMTAFSPEQIAPTLTSLIDNASSVKEPKPAELETVIRVYKALRDIVDAEGLDALTLRCFDLVLALKTTGCFALAQLNDEGIIAGCEGDLVSTVGMLWIYKLLRKLPWMANPAQLNEDRNTLVLAHCTVPRTLVDTYKLRSHFESGLGVGIQGTFPPGPVTLARIGGLKMEQLWLAEGEILHTGDAEELCRTQITVALSRGSVSDLLHAPLGNHLLIVSGHHAERLRTWREAMIQWNFDKS